MNLSLIGKRALVGGGSKGIGKATAIELAGLGATVVLLARSEETLRQVAAALPAEYGQHHTYLVADYTDPEALGRKAEAFLAETGPAHILVNNTGGPPAGPIALARPEEFLAAFRQHLLCNHLLAQAVMPGMKTEGYGRIVNIVSTSVKQPLPNLGVSNTTRGAVASWAKTLATEVASHGITVNNVLPGATATERLESIIFNNSAKSGKTAEEVERHMRAEIPVGRFAAPEEIAAAVAFLASPAAAYITGHSLPVDGGRLSCL